MSLKGTFSGNATKTLPANCSNSPVRGEGTQGDGKKLDIVQGSPGWVTSIQVKHLGGNQIICTYSYNTYKSLHPLLYAPNLTCTYDICIYSHLLILLCTYFLSAPTFICTHPYQHPLISAPTFICALCYLHPLLYAPTLNCTHTFVDVSASPSIYSFQSVGLRCFQISKIAIASTDLASLFYIPLCSHPSCAP